MPSRIGPIVFAVILLVLIQAAIGMVINLYVMIPTRP
jgi:hypothetical protein